MHLLALRHRRQPEAANRCDDVLLPHDVGDVRCGHAEPRHALGVEPDAHAVVALAEDAHLSDARDAPERVVQIEQRVVAQENGVVALVGRREHDPFQQVGRALANRYAVTDHIGGKLTLRNRCAVLHFDRVDVLVGADVERNGQCVRAVVAALRVHVQHVLSAVDLLFHRRGDRLCHHVCVGAGETR